MLDGFLARFVSSNADRFFDRVDEDFTVADFPGLRRIYDSRDRVLDHAVNENHFDTKLKQLALFMMSGMFQTAKPTKDPICTPIN
jgi:hypothetical protein